MNQIAIDEIDKTRCLAQTLANIIKPPMVVYLKGQLGAGKTTFVQNLLSCLGFSGLVKSPTYTIVQTYNLSALNVYHIDCYRLGDPEECEYLGIGDYLDDMSLLLIEWPQKAEGFLPKPDLCLHFSYDGHRRRVAVQAFDKLIAKCLDSVKL